jgi:hypothetical protein
MTIQSSQHRVATLNKNPAYGIRIAAPGSSLLAERLD